MLCKPIIKKRVWGSEKWVLSGLAGDESEVDNGFLEENNINELLEVYLADMVGMTAFQKFGMEFPLLIKYLTVDAFLSVQVHPDDETASAAHNAYGKTEMWYIMEASDDAFLYLGFNQDLTPDEFLKSCHEETLPQRMNKVHPQKGECYFIPAGLAHACGGGLTIAEVQQVSDITYRIYDWGREHDPKLAREMHLDLAMDCIDLKRYTPAPTTTGQLVSCPYFTATYLPLSKQMECDHVTQEGFTIYMGLEGQAQILCDGQQYLFNQGDCVLIPDAVSEWSVGPVQGKVAVMAVTL